MKRNRVLIFSLILVMTTIFTIFGTESDASNNEENSTFEQPNAVIYDESYSISDYWSTENKVAPVKAGYVFGGWFQEVAEGTQDSEQLLSADGTTTLTCVPLTKDDIDSNNDNLIDEGLVAYAKFVPAQVLSVKAQNSQIKNTETQEMEKITADNIDDISSSNPMWIRIMSSTDSKNYKKVGFDIYLANKTRVKTRDGEKLLETTKIYDGVLEGDEVVKANDIFGGVSQYVSVWKLSEIDTPSNKDKIIYVRPYWYTMDGTKVEGLAKYVHIEDDYMNYISVPVNLLNKEDVAKLAAGRVTVTYDNAEDKAIALSFKEVEAGRLLPEMFGYQSGNVIKIMGNAKEVDAENIDDMGNLETIFANIRFQKPEGDTDVDVDFHIRFLEFCDWSEADVVIDEKWDVRYDVK